MGVLWLVRLFGFGFATFSCRSICSARHCYRCLGIIRLAQQYSAQRMEAAAERALLAQACRYQSVKWILKNSLNAVPLSPPQPGSPPLTYDNVRGAEYFDQRGPTSC
jgi:hypothetical protein